MILLCDECSVRHEIPNDKLNDYNICYRWTNTGPSATYAPHLLCQGCTNKLLEIAPENGCLIVKL
jgi:hypothetical protein